MTRREARRRRKQAGGSSRKRFGELRRQKMRENWRDWVVIALTIAGSVIAVVLLDGRTALAFAALLGVFIALALFAWLVGGDAHSLPWMWGAVGEQATAEALEGLDSSWAYEHDLPHRFGNWDHVVVGPAGIFLLDTKNMSGRIHARGDELQSGSIRHRGVGLRRSAAALSEALAQRLGKRPWVQPAYVIWGDFAQRRHEANGVAYVRGDELVSWISGLPE